MPDTLELMAIGNVTARVVERREVITLVCEYNGHGELSRAMGEQGYVFDKMDPIENDAGMFWRITFSRRVPCKS